jgi:hypothetical protein
MRRNNDLGRLFGSSFNQGAQDFNSAQAAERKSAADLEGKKADRAQRLEDLISAHKQAQDAAAAARKQTQGDEDTSLIAAARAYDKNVTTGDQAAEVLAKNKVGFSRRGVHVQAPQRDIELGQQQRLEEKLKKEKIDRMNKFDTENTKPFDMRKKALGVADAMHSFLDEPNPQNWNNFVIGKAGLAQTAGGEIELGRIMQGTIKGMPGGSSLASKVTKMFNSVEGDTIPEITIPEQVAYKKNLFQHERHGGEGLEADEKQYLARGMDKFSGLDMTEDDLRAHMLTRSSEAHGLVDKAKARETDWYKQHPDPSYGQGTIQQAPGMVSKAIDYLDKKLSRSPVAPQAGLTPQGPPAPLTAPQTPTAPPKADLSSIGIGAKAPMSTPMPQGAPDADSSDVEFNAQGAPKGKVRVADYAATHKTDPATAKNAIISQGYEAVEE